MNGNIYPLDNEKDNDSLLEDGLTEDERISMNVMMMKDVSSRNNNGQLNPYNSE